jgi:hypothetical protein
LVWETLRDIVFCTSMLVKRSFKDGDTQEIRLLMIGKSGRPLLFAISLEVLACLAKFETALELLVKQGAVERRAEVESEHVSDSPETALSVLLIHHCFYFVKL